MIIFTKKDDEDEEDEYNGSDHKTEWEKLAEKFGGENIQSLDHKSGGGSNTNRVNRSKELLMRVRLCALT